MAEAPKLRPYIVALSFASGGPLYINACLAPNEAVAAGVLTAEFAGKSSEACTCGAMPRPRSGHAPSCPVYRVPVA